MNQELFSQELTLTDQDAFSSVWNRVMKGRESPIVVGTSVKIAQATPNVTKKISTPSEEKLLCFGEISSQNLLGECILTCSAAVEDYLKLNKQLPQKLKTQSIHLEQQRKQELNQLETAFFLTTGENFLKMNPKTLEFTPSAPLTPEQRLRLRFQDAQRSQAIYQKAALQSYDSCLTTLFLQLEVAMKEEVAALHALTQEYFWQKQLQRL